MSFLLEKSNQNFKACLSFSSAAEYYCSAVHCAYYSCLQMMIHLLITSSDKKESEIFESARVDGNSHKFYIREVSNLIENCNRNMLRQYKKIEDLKDFRIKSDYKNIPIGNTDANRAISIAQDIRNLLSSTFKLNHN